MLGVGENKLASVIPYVFIFCKHTACVENTKVLSFIDIITDSYLIRKPQLRKYMDTKGASVSPNELF